MTIAERVGEVRDKIGAAAGRSGRNHDDIQLIAVTKTQQPSVLAELAAAGVHDYGENRLEHLEDMVPHAPSASRFHYIGRVQSRQFAHILPHCVSLHSLAELHHVAKLARAAERAERQLSVYVQVNTAGEEQKAGVNPAELGPMLEAVRAEAALELAGLMCMAPDRALVSDDLVRQAFASLRVLAQQHGVNGLSMGMSGDYELAVEEGATVLRIGSTLFT